MSEKKDKVVASEVKDRNDAELQSWLAAKSEDLRKLRFKHALGQLRETHQLRSLRRDIAKLNTVLAHRKATAEERT